MITVTLPKYIKKAEPLLDPDTKWCYAGKDVTKRQQIARTLKKYQRFYLKDGLYKAAQDMRQSYLDLVADIGREQNDQLNWWASKFASKSLFHTDFYHLMCYEALIMRLIKNPQEENLVIFIEDPWLFTEIKGINTDSNVRFIGQANLTSKRFFCLLRGLIYRVFLVGWFMVSKLLLGIFHRGRRPKLQEKNTVGIINPAVQWVFKDGQYTSNYLPGLRDFYKEEGIDSIYLYPFPYPLSTAKHLGRNHEVLWPLIADVSILSVIKRVFMMWKPSFSEQTLNKIEAISIKNLLDREKWLTFSTVGFNVHLIQFDAWNSFFNKKWCSHVIYLFENQPWEKMLCLATAKNNIKTIGYQHSSICSLYVSQFIGAGEENTAPLPSKILTAGEHFAKLYKEGGLPDDKVEVGGTWRYNHLLNDSYIENNDSGKHPHASCPSGTSQGHRLRVLISLPLVNPILSSITESLNDTFFSKNDLENIEILLKPHPATDSTGLNIIKRLGKKFNITNDPFSKLVDEADIVVCTQSTSSLESFLYGKKVIPFLPENFIVPEPLLDVTDDMIYKWYEGDDINGDFLKKQAISQDRQSRIFDIRKQYFSKIDPQAWIKPIKA